MLVSPASAFQRSHRLADRHPFSQGLFSRGDRGRGGLPALGRRGAFDPRLAGFGYLVERRIDLRLFSVYVGLAGPGDRGVEAEENEKEGGDNAVKFHREPRARIFLKSLLASEARHSK